MTIRQLSTAQQNEWIERILERLTGIYGRDFTYKWEGLDPDDMKHEWAETLGGFHADDVAAALKSCRAQPKPPNLPEFAAMCRQNMNTRTSVNLPPLTPTEKAAAAKVADKVAREYKQEDENKGYTFNGVLITHYKQWAVELMKREANNEQIPVVSMEAWREVLGFAKDYSAKAGVEKLRSAA